MAKSHRIFIGSGHDARGAFDAGWDCGVIVMEREMSALVRALESKLAMAIADSLIERTKP